MSLHTRVLFCDPRNPLEPPKPEKFKVTKKWLKSDFPGFSLPSSLPPSLPHPTLVTCSLTPLFHIPLSHTPPPLLLLEKCFQGLEEDSQIHAQRGYVSILRVHQPSDFQPLLRAIGHHCKEEKVFRRDALQPMPCPFCFAQGLERANLVDSLEHCLQVETSSRQRLANESNLWWADCRLRHFSLPCCSTAFSNHDRNASLLLILDTMLSDDQMVASNVDRMTSLLRHGVLSNRRLA